jgi:hypothetical protein
MVSGILAFLSVIINCTTPVVVWHLITLIYTGNNGSGLVFAILLAALLFSDNVATSRQKFINNRYVITEVQV